MQYRVCTLTPTSDGREAGLLLLYGEALLILVGTHIMSPHLQKLFAGLDALVGRAPLPELMAALARCEVEMEDVGNHLRYSDRCYQRVPIHSGPWYQAWVMCWRNGQRSPIHDHRGSSCAVRVLHGILTETLFEFAPNGHVKASFSRDILPGQVIGGEDSDLHQVSNLQANDADLVTLHVYSPPLVHMGIYDLSSAHRGLEAMMLEFSDAAGI
jgi:cysteine dioxygenase